MGTAASSTRSRRAPSTSRHYWCSSNGAAPDALVPMLRLPEPIGCPEPPHVGDPLDRQGGVRNDVACGDLDPVRLRWPRRNGLDRAAYWRGWRWAGFAETSTKEVDGKDVQPAKTLWDWLQLLVIPLALAGLAFLLNNSQSNREQQREDQRAASQRKIARDATREETLRRYLTQMSDLILDRKLLRSRPGDDVRAVARTVTLTTVRRLDGERKGVVVRFLHEARLVNVSDPKVELHGANLRSVELPSADLEGANLRGADLRRAHLTAANLQRANLRGTDLQQAQFPDNLRGADLRGASLDPAGLAGVDLRGADLRGVDIEDSNLKSADLRRADLRRASFFGADLRRARLAGADLRRAALGTSSTDLRRAHLAGADLRRAELAGANLRGADLRGAYLAGADLRYSRLRGANLSKAEYDSRTRWSPGFDPVAAGAKRYPSSLDLPRTHRPRPAVPADLESKARDSPTVGLEDRRVVLPWQARQGGLYGCPGPRRTIAFVQSQQPGLGAVSREAVAQTSVEFADSVVTVGSGLGARFPGQRSGKVGSPYPPVCSSRLRSAVRLAASFSIWWRRFAALSCRRCSSRRSRDRGRMRVTPPQFEVSRSELLLRRRVNGSDPGSVRAGARTSRSMQKRQPASAVLEGTVKATGARFRPECA